jgi:hypothetical protein
MITTITIITIIIVTSRGPQGAENGGIPRAWAQVVRNRRKKKVFVFALM